MDLDIALAARKRQQSLPAPQERRRLREACGLSQAEVGAVIGVTRSTVSRWETGRREPRPNLAHRYADVLDRLRKEPH